MKKTIYIIVIVLGLGGAIVMLYLTWQNRLGAPGPAPSSSTIQVNSGAGASGGSSSNSILPHGRNLDFTTLKNFNRDNRFFNYPQVNPSEIGKNLPNLME